jgi:hypothetical protein
MIPEWMGGLLAVTTAFFWFRLRHQIRSDRRAAKALAELGSPSLPPTPIPGQPTDGS